MGSFFCSFFVDVDVYFAFLFGFDLGGYCCLSRAAVSRDQTASDRHIVKMRVDDPVTMTAECLDTRIGRLAFTAH